MAKFRAENAGQILLCYLSGRLGLIRPSVFLLKFCLSFLFLSSGLNLHQNELHSPTLNEDSMTITLWVQVTGKIPFTGSIESGENDHKEFNK
jgi:hypothetical protein